MIRMRLSVNIVILRNSRMTMMTWRQFRMTTLMKKRCKESSRKIKCTHLRMKMKKTRKTNKMMMMRTWKMKIWKKLKKKMKT
jgi:hypothetical protein